VFLGAWREHELAAFLSITAVDDWAEIEGSFSANDSLPLRPNDTLIATALSNYLVKKGCALVTYGLSSIQAQTTAEGLHQFKMKVGFEARPVHRAFALNPLVRPFANTRTQRCISTMLRLSPGSRLLRKCDGMLSLMLRREAPIA
jgi:hypothetical protein